MDLLLRITIRECSNPIVTSNNYNYCRELSDSILTSNNSITELSY